MKIYDAIKEAIAVDTEDRGIHTFTDLLKMDEGPYNEFEEKYMKYEEAVKKLEKIKEDLDNYPEDKKGARWEEFKVIDRANKEGM